MKHYFIILISLFLQVVLWSQNDSIYLSEKSKICTDTVFLSIKGNFDYAYYSTDGAIPSKKRYKKPLIITKNSFILFRCVYKSLHKDTIIARSFIFDTTSHFPILSVGIEEENLWDSKKGIYTRGANAFYSDSTEHWENCNFQQKWEKPVFVIYIDSTRQEVINQQAGIRIFGESTRRQPDKSMKIVARKKYGNKRFNYPFFKDKPNISEYKQLVIRTSGNDYNNTRFKDVLNAYLVKNLGIDYMAFQPIRLYVNGKYWGVYNLREKINKHYLYYNHNANKDSSSIIMGRWVTQHGNRKKYMEMYNWFLKLDTMDNIAYQKAQEYLDIRNYINYRAFQIFINNTDSRGNVRYWNSTDLDGKFRMILYDTDLSFGSIKKDYLSKCLSPTQTNWFNNTWSTLYFRKLMQNKQFKNEFINQYAHLMNTALHTDTILSAIDYFENLYKNELPRTKEELPSHFRNVPIPMEKWLKNIDRFRYYAKKRPEIARKEITETLAKDGTFTLIINAQNGQVNINNNYHLPLPFSGIYFKNIPLPISVKADSGYLFKGWKNTTTLKQDTTIIAQRDTIFLFPIFEKIPAPQPTKKATTTTHKPIDKKNNNNKKLLWLLGWTFIGLGGVLLIVYFKLRVK